MNIFLNQQIEHTSVFDKKTIEKSEMFMYNYICNDNSSLQGVETLLYASCADVKCLLSLTQRAGGTGHILKARCYFIKIVSNLLPPDCLVVFYLPMGDRMKRFFVIIFALLPIYANATDMCARDDTMVLVFDKDVGGSGGGSNVTEWTWWVNFAYGRIAGEATCLSAAEGLGRTSGAGAYYGTGDYSKTFIEAEPGLSGTDSDGNDRKYCWCKMTHPVSSHWVFSYVPVGSSSCASVCAKYCSNVHAYSELREGVFNSVGL